MNILGWNASYDKINRYIDIYKQIDRYIDIKMYRYIDRQLQIDRQIDKQIDIKQVYTNLESQKNNQPNTKQLDS